MKLELVEGRNSEGGLGQGVDWQCDVGLKGVGQVQVGQVQVGQGGIDQKRRESFIFNFNLIF